MIKRITDVLLVTGLLFSLAGCNLVKNNSNDDNNSVSSTNDNKMVEIAVERFLNIIDDELSIYLGYDSIDDIKNQDKLRLIYDKYVSSYGDDFDLAEFPAADLQKYFTDSSIIDFGYKNEDIYCNGHYGDSKYILWNYIKEEDKYVLNKEHIEDVLLTNNVMARKVIEYKNSNNRYTIKINYLFGYYVADENSVYLYGSYYDFMNKNDVIVSLGRDTDQVDFNNLALNYLNNNYDNIKDRLASYEYVFTYSNNKIKLVDFSVN